MKYTTPSQLLRSELNRHEQALMVLEAHVAETPEYAAQESYRNMAEIRSAILMFRTAIRKLGE